MLVTVVEAAKGALGPATVSLLDADAEVQQLEASLSHVEGGAGYTVKLEVLLGAARAKQQEASAKLDARKAEYQQLQELVAKETTPGLRASKAAYDAVADALDPALRAEVGDAAARLVNKGPVAVGQVVPVNYGHRFVQAQLVSHDAEGGTCEALLYREDLGAGWFTHGHSVACTLPREHVYCPSASQGPPSSRSPTARRATRTAWARSSPSWTRPRPASPSLTRP